jgi:hypothetical protein
MKTTTRSTPEYRYRGANARLIASQEPEVMLEGPAGTGKSVAILWKIHRAPEVSRHAGPDRAADAGIAHPVNARDVRKQTCEGLVSEDCGIGVQRRVRQSYRYPNGSEIVVGGLDKPSKVMSTEYDLIYVNEATRDDRGGL